MRKRPLSSTFSLQFAVGLSFISLSSPAAAQPITFRFEGTYDPSFTPPPEYAIDIGTPVQGEFSYDLATVDTAVGDDVPPTFITSVPLPPIPVGSPLCVIRLQALYFDPASPCVFEATNPIWFICIP